MAITDGDHCAMMRPRATRAGATGFLELPIAGNHWPEIEVAPGVLCACPCRSRSPSCHVIAIVIAIRSAPSRAQGEHQLDHVWRVVAIAASPRPVLARLMSADPGAQLSAMTTGKPWLPPIDYVPLWQDPLPNLSMVLLLGAHCGLTAIRR